MAVPRDVQVFPGPPTARREAACPSTVVAGDAVLLGKIPAIALTSYSSLSGTAVFETGGTYRKSVTAATVLSPVSGLAIKQGDKIYADTNGTLDSSTNVTTGFTLDANSSTGTLFGYLDPQYQATILTTATDAAAWVKLAGSE